jgi:succinate dehydrogenase / fumarate reductase cytochrome b subunit
MKENYFWHKLHSLTGIIPIGYYLVQHLSLNSFSLGGAEKFNTVVEFFEALPTHVILAIKLIVVWIPLIFHAVYGLFITARGNPNYTNAAYKYRENRYYFMQRVSGIVAFIFLAYHMTSTSLLAQLRKWNPDYTAEEAIAHIQYESWAEKLAAPVIGGNETYLILLVYIIGVLASSYHFAYGIWNFCIRWGITINEKAQQATAKLAAAVFVVLSALGILALVGFYFAPFEKEDPIDVESVTPPVVEAPVEVEPTVDS